MTASDYYSENSQVARTKLLAACQDLRLNPIELKAPQSQQETESPLIDCLRLGSPDASRLLVICGGDRMADSLCCSAIETNWLRHFGQASLPSDSALVLLHHGPAPATGGEIPDQGRPPPEWKDDILARVEERYAEYARLQGIDSSGTPLSGGGDGDAPGYPRRVLDELAKSIAPTPPAKIIFLEIRVGTGPWGEAEVTPCHPPDTAGEKRVRTWFSLPEPSEDSIAGERTLDSLGASLQRRFPKSQMTAAVASFGTYSMLSVLELLAERPDGQTAPPTTQMIYPDNPEWREAVWKSAIVVIQRALTGLYAK